MTEVNNPDRGREAAVQIIFDTTNFTKEQMTKLREAESLLTGLGIFFRFRFRHR